MQLVFVRYSKNLAKLSDFQHFLFFPRKKTGKTTRLGVVVPKKHVKLAVKRNSMKRVVRECFRHVTTQQNNFGRDIVVVIKQDFSSSSQVRNCLKRVLHAG